MSDRSRTLSENFAVGGSGCASADSQRSTALFEITEQTREAVTRRIE
jgi:hypothetical protein